MTEIHLGEQVLAFDGRVVEIFGIGGDTASERYHVSLIEKIEFAPALFGKGAAFLNIFSKRITNLGIKIPVEKRAEVEHFISTVMNAKETYRFGQ